MKMSLEQNKALVRHYVEDINNKNLDAAFSVVSPDFVDHNVHSETGANVQVTRQLLNLQFAAFPDVRANITDIIAEDDKVVTRMIVRGTNTGPFMGMPPTGKPAMWSFIDIFRIADGKIAEHWSEMDSMVLMQQLGLVPHH